MAATQTCVMKAEPEEVPLYSGKNKGFAVQWLGFKSWICTDGTITSENVYQFPVAAIAIYKKPGDLTETYSLTVLERTEV